MSNYENIHEKILCYSDFDRQLWEEELAEFVPLKIFDAHAHMWNDVYTTTQTPNNNDWREYNTGMAEQQNISRIFYPGCETHFLAFATPVKYAAYNGLNAWVNSEVSSDPLSYAAMLVSPEMKGEYVGEFIKQHFCFVALKPYPTLTDTSFPALHEYLPEEQMEVADEHHLAIVLHLPDEPERSLPELEHFSGKYTRIKWILAHCAASFRTCQLERIIHRLCGIPNIWYDTAIIAEPTTLSLLLKYGNKKRILFGTDNALRIGGCRRGHKPVNTGYGLSRKYANYITFHCYEQLLAMRQACRQSMMTVQEIEAIFHDNAKSLFDSCRVNHK